MAITNVEFKRAISPSKTGQEIAYFFIYCDNSIFIDEREDQKVSIPILKMDEALKLKLEDICFLGMIGDRNCYSSHAPTLNIVADVAIRLFEKMMSMLGFVLIAA